MFRIYMPPTLFTPVSGGLGAYNHEKVRVCHANLQDIKLGLSTGGLFKISRKKLLMRVKIELFYDSVLSETPF